MAASDIPTWEVDRSVPIALREGLGAIVAVTDQVCHQHIDAEYADLCRTLAVRLSRKGPSPLDRGEPRIWAAGVVYTGGWINFLFDKSHPPHVRAAELADHIEVPKSTMANKSAQIRTLLGLSWYEPELTRPEHARAKPVRLDGHRERDPGRRANAPG